MNLIRFILAQAPKPAVVRSVAWDPHNYRPPTPVVRVDTRTPGVGPARRAARQTSTKGSFASTGRTNGMPWDGTSPCTVSTDPLEKGPSKSRTEKNWHARMIAAQKRVDHAEVVQIGRSVLDSLESQPAARAAVLAVVNEAFQAAVLEFERENGP